MWLQSKGTEGQICWVPSNCLIVVLATDKGSVINVNINHRDRGADFQLSLHVKRGNWNKMNNYLRLGQKALGLVEMTLLWSVLDNMGGPDGGQMISKSIGLWRGMYPAKSLCLNIINLFVMFNVLVYLTNIPSQAQARNVAAGHHCWAEVFESLLLILALAGWSLVPMDKGS